MKECKLISRRGNTKGSNLDSENNPEYIESALRDGFDVMVDLWVLDFNKPFFLGEREPQYPIENNFLIKHADFLWAKCKTMKALWHLMLYRGFLNFFYIDKEDFVLTTSKHIWTTEKYKGPLYKRNVIETDDIRPYAKLKKEDRIAALCSDCFDFSNETKE